MSLDGGTLLPGGTTSTTGGTSTALASKGNTLLRHDLYLDDASELLNQENFEFTIQKPVSQAAAPNGWTQARTKVRTLVPLNLDNGNRTINTAIIEIATDVETTAAEKLALREHLAQLLVDSDFTKFWDDQNLS